MEADAGDEGDLREDGESESEDEREDDHRACQSQTSDSDPLSNPTPPQFMNPKAEK